MCQFLCDESYLLLFTMAFAEISVMWRIYLLKKLIRQFLWGKEKLPITNIVNDWSHICDMWFRTYLLCSVRVIAPLKASFGENKKKLFYHSNKNCWNPEHYPTIAPYSYAVVESIQFEKKLHSYSNLSLFNTYHIIMSIIRCSRKPENPTVKPIRPINAHLSQSTRASWRFIQFFNKQKKIDV